MAYYAIVTDVTRPQADVVMIHFDVIDDTDESLVMRATHGFQAVRYDEAGVIINETYNQAVARLAAEFDAYTDRLMTASARVDSVFEQFVVDAVGYRNPPA